MLVWVQLWAMLGGEWHLLEAGPGHLDTKEMPGQSQKEQASAGSPSPVRLGPGVCVCVQKMEPVLEEVKKMEIG